MNRPKQWASLELRHLIALEAIVEHGSFHKAAGSLDYTQSGVSQQIAALERIVGERVVERLGGSRPVRLTPCGEVLLTHAREIFGQIAAAQADVDAVRNGDTGLLRVGAFQSVGATVLPELMRRLARRRPALRVELVQTTSDPELFELLEVGRLDVTFAMLPVPEGPFAVRELFSDPFVLLVAADSALARRDAPLSLSDLAELALIAPHACRYTAHLETQLRERGFKPNVAHRSDDNGTVFGLVAAGAGVAFVPRLVAAQANGDIAVLEIDEDLPPRRIALSWCDDRLLPVARAAFADEVGATCAALGLRIER